MGLYVNKLKLKLKLRRLQCGSDSETYDQFEAPTLDYLTGRLIGLSGAASR